MWNARVVLFRILIPECTERHSIHSAFRGRMNRMLRMKTHDGGRRGKRCRFKRAPTVPVGEKIRLHFWIQWNIASYFFVPKVRGAFQWCFLQEKCHLAKDCRRHVKWLFSIGNKVREQVEVVITSSSGKCEEKLLAATAASLLAAIFTHTSTAFFMYAIRLFWAFLYQSFLFQYVNNKLNVPLERESCTHPKNPQYSICASRKDE